MTQLAAGQSHDDVNKLALLVGLRTEFRRGNKRRRGLITGVFAVTGAYGTDGRFVIEVSERGHYHYLDYAELGPVRPNLLGTLAAA